MKCQLVARLLLAISLSILLCQCGGDSGKEAEGGQAGVQDPVELTRTALFPQVETPLPQLTPEGLEAIQKKTWSEILETISEKPPVWEAVTIEDSPNQRGARAHLVIAGTPAWVLFEVADEGSGVVPIKLGEGEDVKTDKPDKIVLGLAGFYGMKTGTLDRDSVISRIQYRTIQNKNLLALRNLVNRARVVALDNGGLYPDQLDTLLKKTRLPAENYQVTDPETEELKDPVYFIGVTDSSPGEWMLFACPFKNPDNTRTVAFANGTVQHIAEEDYQANLDKPENVREGD